MQTERTSHAAYTMMPTNHHSKALSRQLNALLMKSLRHPAVRRLAYATLSPSLFEKAPLTGYDKSAYFLRAERLEQKLGVQLLSEPDIAIAWQAHLMALEKAPEPLEALLNSTPSQRLGRYFETLWLYFFNWHPDVSVLMHNRPIHTCDVVKRTLGEVDVILKHSLGAIIHIELALKYYLQVSPNVWLGTNERDALENKLKKLLDHQLLLSRHQDIQDLLPSPVSDRYVLMRGMLIIPINPEYSLKSLSGQTSLATYEQQVASSLINFCLAPFEAAPVGYWGKASSWCTLLQTISNKSQHPCILQEMSIELIQDKKRWLGPSLTQASADSATGQLIPFDASDLKKRLIASVSEGRSAMLAMVLASEIGLQSHPIGFCVPDHYPTSEAINLFAP